MKKKILFISPTGTLDNGAEISIVNLMEYLVETGHQVINAIPDYHVAVQQDYISSLAALGIETVALPSVKWWWEDSPGGLPGSPESRARSYQDNTSALRKILTERKIDLVITNTVNMFQGAVAAACEDVPHFWLIHEFPDGEFGYYKEKLDFISDYSQEIFAVRGALQRQLQNLLPDRKVLSFAPFTKIYPTDTGERDGVERRIVSVGRLTERKNQLELIKAYNQLSQPKPALVFIGSWDDEYKKRCDTYISEHQIKNISFLGHKDNPWAEVTAADLAVFPSAMETFGLVYIEAIMNGLPTILSDNPGHLSAYEIFEEGQLYSSGNIEELADKINLALANFEGLKDQSVANLGKIQERYTVQSVYQTLLDKIENTEMYKANSLRHVKCLLDTNLPSQQASSFLRKVKNKLLSGRRG